MIQKETKIGEVVARNFHTARIFENHGLDFCCGGKKTIETACIENGINTDEFLAELDMLNNSNPSSAHFDKWEADFLTDYIINNHHAYVLNNLPLIEQHLSKVVFAHAEKHPGLLELESTFIEFKSELLEHMAKEERMLFPYIKKLCFARKNNIEIPYPPFGSLDNPVKVMEAEHDNAGSYLRKLNELTGNYNPPADACATYKVLFAELKEFSDDLHMHVHLENNVLFPKAKQLEENLNKHYSTL